MNDHRAIVGDVNRSFEAIAAELTAAAYPVALRHAVEHKWLDLELELWRALFETVSRLQANKISSLPGDSLRVAKEL